MSKDFVRDIAEMHKHYNVNAAVASFDAEKLKTLLEFRIAFLKEEYDELNAGVKNPEDIVDALIDLIVVAIGTLDLYQVDSYAAWDAVLAANMAKTPGVNPNRPNPLGLPDLLKPAGWTAPSHEGNHGTLTKIN